MIFYALTFAEPPREVLKTWAWKARVLTPPEFPANVNVQENHVWSHYCMKTQCDARKLENFEETAPLLCFLWLNRHRKDTFTECILKTPLPVQRPKSSWRHVFTFATMHVTDADIAFCDGPGMLAVKTAKQVYNSMWITLLKYGFVPVKIWPCRNKYCYSYIFSGYMLYVPLPFLSVKCTGGVRRPHQENTQRLVSFLYS